MKVKLLVLFFTFLYFQSSYAQLDLSAFTATGRGGVATTFATDYQTVGINPANLGFRKSFRDPTFTLGILEGNSSINTEALNRRDLLRTIFNSSSIQFSQAEKEAAADQFNGSSSNINIAATLLGASYHIGNNHTVALNIRDRLQLFTRINENTAEILFLGYNASYFPDLILSNNQLVANPRNTGGTPLSEEEQREVILGGYQLNPDSAQTYAQILQGSRISTSWYREFNLSYGTKIFDSYDFSLYAGIGVKYIRGILYIDLAANDGVTLDPSIISISPTFGVDFGDDPDIVQSPTFRAPEEDVSAFRRTVLPESVGSGYGFDFGLTMVIRQNLYVGMALTNLGEINWSGNVYNISDGRLVNFGGSGLTNYNIFGAQEGAFQFAGDLSPFNFGGIDPITQVLPATFRLGASYEFFRTFHFGFDVITPLNDVAGNIENTIWAVGGDYRPNKLFRISSGLNAGTNSQGFNLPFGLTYLSRRGYYEAGVATQDITTFFADVGNESNFSVAMGFLRFKL